MTGFENFAGRPASPLCVRNNSIQLHFLASQYPDVRLQVTGPTTASMLDAVLRGTCAGGVDDELLLRWLLGDGDAAGAYCGIEAVGLPTPGAYPFALPVPLSASRAPGPAALHAMNTAIAAALYDGNYSAAEGTYLPRDRPLAQCAAYFAGLEASGATGVQPLSARDMAGVFIHGRRRGGGHRAGAAAAAARRGGDRADKRRAALVGGVAGRARGAAATTGGAAAAKGGD